MNQEQVSKLEIHDEVLFGRDGELGIAQKVKVIWRIYTYILYAAGIFTGWIIKWAVDNWFLVKHI